MLHAEELSVSDIQSMGMFVAVSAGYISEVAGPRTRATAMSVLAATPIVGIVCGVGIGGNAKIIGNVASDWGSWRLMMASELAFHSWRSDLTL